jgi:hypothetical protein
MNTEQIQNVLFAAYDLRNSMTNEDKARPINDASFGETFGSNLDELIEFLEQLEEEAE